MNKIISSLMMVLSLTFLSCDDFSLSSIKLDCNREIIVDNSLYENSPNDIYNFKSVEIKGNCLNITIEYGGGCGDIELKLIDSEYVMESIPVQRNLRLSFKDEDYCKALITKKISFDITPIQIQGESTIVLNLANWDEQILYYY